MSRSASLSALIWSVADLLGSDYKPSEYGRVILPFTVLRRLDCVLAPTKAAVLAERAKREPLGIDPEPFLLRVAKMTKTGSGAIQDKQKLQLAAIIQAINNLSTATSPPVTPWCSWTAC